SVVASVTLSSITLNCF
ncbi:prolipodiacylglyceryl transferase family protein, partial [Vibrio parahaemolyticus EKP-028]